jgi:hypothetical protein
LTVFRNVGFKKNDETVSETRVTSGQVIAGARTQLPIARTPPKLDMTHYFMSSILACGDFS